MGNKREKLKIVQISKNSLPVPPVDYGGTERDIYYLTEELIRRGHEVILFAKKGSKSSAKTFEFPSDDKQEQLDFIIRHMPPGVDIIHDHNGVASEANPPIPTIRNSHWKKTPKGKIAVYVSKTILNSVGKGKGFYVHNGIRVKDYSYSEKKDDYLLFIGRMSPDKGVHHAIEVAKKTGRRLLIAGPYRNKEETRYFQKEIKPLLSDRIVYVGSVGGQVKQDLLSKAYCVLFPSVWNEPFGLVQIEALACGTPVLTFTYGSAPEVMKGFPQLMCSSTKEMIDKVKSGADFPPPKVCRDYVKKHFTDKTMTDGFLKLYRKILSDKLYQVETDSEWMKRKRKLGI
ncbi:glycosyltransferase family 4 protein [Paenibacillus hexagrammi]|uniref:Glycosyltransferase family 4 protein n=1 Tax=Paenibacillus hexagrammi TaxID=2908839 RepID=A0ABY3SGB2_9BACL|nr:glycosyltransferase family 4 protein [Paenibacillus sp. YPD9-1]UJF32125.1 glycosyltransferase family 4 protein [Paenibacillus sp. YPD9-1]